jgi:hypothetical protein
MDLECVPYTRASRIMCQTALSQADIGSGRVAAEERKVESVELSERAFIAAYLQHQDVST